MGQLKELFVKINAKIPVLKLLFWIALLGDVAMVYFLIDLFTFKPDFLVLYGLPDAGTVRSRVEEQMRRYKPKPAPPPPPIAQMSHDVRKLQQSNPFLAPGTIEFVIREEKTTDVAGIELIGTVYSYTPDRRTALVEFNGVAVVVAEGKLIRGSQKKVVEIGRSRIVVQEGGLLPSPVFLPEEHGLDSLSQQLATNQFKTESNWEYTTRTGRTVKPKEETKEGEEAPEDAEAKPATKSKAKKSEEPAADEEVADEESEEEESSSESTGDKSSEPGASSSTSSSGSSSGATDGVDLGGGE